MNLETIACPLCGSMDYEVIYPAVWPEHITPDFLTKVYSSSSDQVLFEQLVQCTQCDLQFLNPRLSADEIEKSYAKGEDATFIHQNRLRIKTFSEILRNITRKYGITAKKSTCILDIGCAGGAFVEAAQALGYTCVGVEPSEWLAQRAREQGLDVRTGTLAQQQFTDTSFSVITLWDVIEHLADPGAVLRNVHRLLADDGYLVVNYPDIGSMPSRLLRKKWPFLLSVHLLYYTRKTIRQQLEQCGFSILCYERHWQTLELGYVLHRASKYFPIIAIFERLVKYIHADTWAVKYWVGQVRVIAKKT